jgi:hypothetical protein
VGNDPTNARDSSGLEEKIVPTTEQELQLVAGRLGYFYNAGWVDFDHTDPTFAKEILKLIEKEENRMLSLNSPREYGPRPGTFIIQIRAPAYGWKERLLYPCGTYRIDVGVGKDPKRREAVALAIFMHYSRLYEEWQGEFPLNLLTNSSFSQEDLVSNLLSFYRALNDWDEAQFKKILGEKLPDDEALRLLRSFGGDLGLSMNKNYYFIPYDWHNRTTTFRGKTLNFCLGPSGTQGVRIIRPANKGNGWEVARPFRPHRMID